MGPLGPLFLRVQYPSVKTTHGTAGAYVDTQVGIGDVLNASALRGSFTLKPGDGPVVVLSAGIGATPVLAMLHELARYGLGKGGLVDLRRPPRRRASVRRRDARSPQGSAP